MIEVLVATFIYFTVAGQKVFAHKVIVCSRCDVMAAMFDGGHFLEGISSTSEVK